MIAAIGLWRLGRHLGGHGEHDQDPQVKPIDLGNRDLIGLGLAGGLVPCWDAVILILLAEAVGRLALGLALLTAFSLGMALVLVSVGLLAARLQGFILKRRDRGEKSGSAPVGVARRRRPSHDDRALSLPLARRAATRLGGVSHSCRWTNPKLVRSNLIPAACQGLVMAGRSERKLCSSSGYRKYPVTQIKARITDWGMKPSLCCMCVTMAAPHVTPESSRTPSEWVFGIANRSRADQLARADEEHVDLPRLHSWKPLDNRFRAASAFRLRWR